MSDISPEKFFRLCEISNQTHELLQKMDKKVDDHTLQIRDLENHDSNMKKAIKWVGSGIAAVFAVVVWITS